MIYPFKCDKLECGEYVEVFRPASDSGLPQTCFCGNEMRRIYTPTLFAIDNQNYFDHSLGVHVRNRSDVKDAVKKLRDGKVNGRDVYLKDEKGREYIEKRDVPGIDVVEVGNEKPKLTRPYNNYNNYDLPSGCM